MWCCLFPCIYCFQASCIPVSNNWIGWYCFFSFCLLIEKREVMHRKALFFPPLPLFMCKVFALCFETLIVTNQCIIVPEGPIFGDMQDVGPRFFMGHCPPTLQPNWICIYLNCEYVVLQSKNPVACTMFYHVNVNPHWHHHHHQFGTQRFITLIYFYNILNQ